VQDLLQSVLEVSSALQVPLWEGGCSFLTCETVRTKSVFSSPPTRPPIAYPGVCLAVSSCTVPRIARRSTLTAVLHARSVMHNLLGTHHPQTHAAGGDKSGTLSAVRHLEADVAQPGVGAALHDRKQRLLARPPVRRQAPVQPAGGAVRRLLEALRGDRRRRHHIVQLHHDVRACMA
jgi:hypothetical protein